MGFKYLVRFVADDGNTYYGDAILPSGTTDIGQTKQAKIIEGDIYGSYTVTDKIMEVKQLLSPLSRKDCTSIKCIGLNYARHAREAKMAIPENPVLFYKPITSLNGPFSPIPIPPPAQWGNGLDYEGELIIIISKPAYNIPASSALDYILGYTVGNDMSHRDWQIKRGGSQWTLGKGFDGWAPIGPGIVSPEVIKDAGKLGIQTKVNGKVVQDSSTSDLIFKVEEIVSFLSQGTTLLPGDVIFTGTPEGVQMGAATPSWLKDGDVVEVSIEGIGAISNQIKFTEA